MILAVDPGVSGGWAIFETKPRTGHNGKVVASGPWKKGGLSDTVESFRPYWRKITEFVIEEVHASPQMGTTSAFSFGKNFGEWLGFAHQLPLKQLTQVRPQIWEYWVKKNFWETAAKNAGVDQSHWKDKHKKALRLCAEYRFPGVRMTDKVCDALLIGDWWTEKGRK